MNSQVLCLVDGECDSLLIVQLELEGILEFFAGICSMEYIKVLIFVFWAMIGLIQQRVLVYNSNSVSSGGDKEGYEVGSLCIGGQLGLNSVRQNHTQIR